MQGLYAVWLNRRVGIAPKLTPFHPMIVKKSFWASKWVYTASYGTFIAKDPLRLAPEWSLNLVRIRHLAMDLMCV